MFEGCASCIDWSMNNIYLDNVELYVFGYVQILAGLSLPNPKVISRYLPSPEEQAEPKRQTHEKP